MFKKVDHMAIAVKDLEEAKERMLKMGAEFIVEQDNPKEKYKVAIFLLGELCFSLLWPTSPDSFVQKHLETKGESIQHLGIEVANLDETSEQLKQNGVKVSNYEEFDTRREALVSPKHLFGYVLQLMEWQGETKNMSQKDRMYKTWVNK